VPRQPHMSCGFGCVMPCDSGVYGRGLKPTQRARIKYSLMGQGLARHIHTPGIGPGWAPAGGAVSGAPSSSEAEPADRSAHALTRGVAGW
jgi:hypothetical protein